MSSDTATTTSQTESLPTPPPLLPRIVREKEMDDEMAADPLLCWGIEDAEAVVAETEALRNMPFKYVYRRDAPLEFPVFLLRPRQDHNWICSGCFCATQFDCIHIRRAEKEYELLPRRELWPTDVEKDVLPLMQKAMLAGLVQLHFDGNTLAKLRTVMHAHGEAYAPVRTDVKVEVTEYDAIMAVREHWQRLECGYDGRIAMVIKWNQLCQNKFLWEKLAQKYSEEFVARNEKYRDLLADLEKAGVGLGQEKGVEVKGEEEAVA